MRRPSRKGRSPASLPSIHGAWKPPHNSSFTAAPGMSRLLLHCEAVGRHDAAASPALTRLERALGSDLASRLVTALASHRGRSSLAV